MVRRKLTRTFQIRLTSAQARFLQAEANKSTAPSVAHVVRELIERERTRDNVARDNVAQSISRAA